MKSKLIDGAVWLVGIAICGLIGACLLVAMLDLIDYTRDAACFDYRDPEVCEEAIR